MAHFLDIAASVAHSPQSPYALLPIPYERTTSFGKGTKNGPRALIEASRAIEKIDEELLQPIDIAVQTLPALRLARSTPAAAMQAIYKCATRLHKHDRFVLGVGGEHTVSVPLIAAAADRYRNLSVLQFDAHLDLRDKYTGTKYSHATPMRRITEMQIPVVHAGIRSVCDEELSFSREHRTPICYARDMVGKDAKRLGAELCRHLTDNVYITFDVDALDPSIMPGTGTPEPGGLDWYLATGILREIIKRKNVVSADIVELSPIKGSNVSEYTAARLALKLLTYRFYKKRL